ncbi:peroxisome proliferator-activated receptor gamma coactivator 1-beta [Nerophis ophidion]|uniref:peroxisome proliferator-activated receptor gamma coactivator 1-beta n=1 Tax=Nerophis ophidion TaxID=159077 RepID=UPI002AE09F6F|nr:peroxisome proliferator-activated receptor gamma coactivator 1-beta [Nerophis ophidion]
MADCAPLLDEELSSFVFNYLTENPDSQYGEEEVCSDRLDTDFPDIDLSQLDTSDFDSVNCLGELPWCSDQVSDASPASIHYSTNDQLFEIEEENAALLAALTDSLDGMVDAEVGGLSVFPALGEEPGQDEEDKDRLSLSADDFGRSPRAEMDSPSLLEKLLLTPPNVPAGKDGHRYSNKGWRLRPARPQAKMDPFQERKPRAVRPAGRLCTELHRHLTTTRSTEEPRAADTEEDEEDEDSESEEDDEEEEEEESSTSEAEGAATTTTAEPQFSSEKELHSVVALITYMHTYCMPARKQQGLDRKDPPRPRARPDALRPPATNSHSRLVLVETPVTGGCATRRLPFVRRREVKANSLLRDLLQQRSSFDVSKPYRLLSPPYTRGRGGANTHTPSSAPVKQEKDSPERRRHSYEAAKNPAEDGASFSVRRSRRLASFPSRFAKRLRPERAREGDGMTEREDGPAATKLSPTQAGGGTTTEAQTEKPQRGDPAEATEISCHSEKRACLCLPLNASKSTGEFSTKSFEQTLSMDLCGTAGLTPPTTPPHKPVEDELFKPAEAAKGGGGGGEGGTKGSWLSRAHQRKLPEQTELYAQLRRMGQAGDGDACHGFGDHDYCALSLGESRKRSIAMLGAMLQAPGEAKAGTEATREDDGESPEVTEPQERQEKVQTSPPPPPPPGCQLPDATPPSSEEEAERSSGSRSPSPTLHLCPDSPASKTDSSENSEVCPDEEQRSRANSDEENCQVFYIHNLPSSMTQSMLRKRFQVFGKADDCKVIICNEERCGVIKIRQSGIQRHRRERENVFQSAQATLRRLARKRYIDLDEAGPGPIKSKYDALDFDTLLKEAQKSLHR